MSTSVSVLEIGAVLLAAAAAGALARRAHLPAVIGYLAVGLVVSPFTPGYVADREQLELLADVGVVLLLFEVGIEIDIDRLRREHGRLLVAAPLQVVITTAASAALFVLAGQAAPTAAVLGLCVALSSSVVIVNIVRSRRRVTTPATEQALLGWSVLQDLCGVLLAAVLLAWAGVTDRPPAWALMGLVGLGLLSAAAAVLLPRVLRALTDEPDLFLVVSIATGLALAGVGATVFGVPLALSAFVAGLAISESPESVAARRRLLPFRDVFAVLFFVAVGTLIDPASVVAGAGWLALMLVALVVGKVLVTWGGARWAGAESPGRLAIGSGQIGELSFVLASLLAGAGAITAEQYAAVLAAVALSIGASAVAVRARPTAGARPGPPDVAA